MRGEQNVAAVGADQVNGVLRGEAQGVDLLDGTRAALHGDDGGGEPFLAQEQNGGPERGEDEYGGEDGLHYSSRLKSVMRTPIVSSMMTISPDPISAPPMRISIFSPAERVIRITLSTSSASTSRNVIILRSSSISTATGTSAMGAISSRAVIRYALDLRLMVSWLS